MYNEELNFKSIELSRYGLINMMNEAKTASVLNKFSMGEYIKKDSFNQISRVASAQPYRKYLIPEFEKYLKGNAIAEEKLISLNAMFKYWSTVGDYRYRYQNSSLITNLDGVSSFMEKGLNSFNEFNNDINNDIKILDILFFTFKNYDKYRVLFNRIFSTIKDIELNEEYSKSLFELIDSLTSISKDTRVVDFSELPIIAKLHGSIKKFNHSLDEDIGRSEYIDTLQHIASEFDDTVMSLFTILKFSDLDNKSFNSEKALKRIEEIFKDRDDPYIDFHIQTDREGFNIIDYIKEYGEGFFGVELFKITEPSELDILYDIWGEKIFNYEQWGLVAEIGDEEEIMNNKTMVQDYNCSYYYDNEVAIFSKSEDLNENKCESRLDDRQHIKSVIKLEYAYITNIIYASKEIDKLINAGNKEDLMKLTANLDFINFTLCEKHSTVSKVEIITKESELFPKNSPYDYAIISITSKLSEHLTLEEDADVKSTYLNYFDAANIQRLNSSLFEVKSILQKYKAEV